MNWHESLLRRPDELQTWMGNLGFSGDVAAECAQKLNAYVERNKERLSRIDGDALVYSIDGHGENALYSEGKLQFIDILFPAARWRWTTEEYDIFRLGTDIFALTGEKNFNAYLGGAKKIYQDFDETDKDFYLLYCAALDGCVLKTLAKSKPEKEKQLQKYYEWFLERLRTFKPEYKV